MSHLTSSCRSIREGSGGSNSKCSKISAPSSALSCMPWSLLHRRNNVGKG